MSSPQCKNFHSPIQDSAILALQRSSSFSSSNNSNNSKGMRETGIIEKLLHSYGFIECCERQARLFFHFSQFTDNIDHLNIGDPVEFEMTFDRKNGKPIASSVSKISPEVVSYEVLSEERVSGTVTTEIKNKDEIESANYVSNQGRITYENRGECFFLPYTIEDIESGKRLKAGDKVTFQIATEKSTGALHARNIQSEKKASSERLQGVICSLKETFGFIERADIVKEIFFHASEAKGFQDLDAGDDVEFTIQARNGKDVAVNILRLPEGTVVFEDIGEEKAKGQIIKPLERHRHLSDPLPGRIRSKSDSLTEMEIQYGNKDQIGEFTLMPNDWVQFNIATDRRDHLKRATNIELLQESFLISGEVRERGTVVAVKEGFGFIKCQDREARMFFHFSELLDQSREVQFHDEVEFTVIQDPATPGRQNAIRIAYLPSGSVKFETVSSEILTGTVEKEPESQFSRSPSKAKDENGKMKPAEAGVIVYDEVGKLVPIMFYNTDCDPRNSPKVGDKVQFNVCESKCNGSKVALDIKVIGRSTKNGFKYTSQGFIAALKDGFGFIETAEHDREVFFHFSVYAGDATLLDLGCEVEYGVSQKNSKVSAECVRKLASGTILVEEPKNDEVLEGIVTRPVRCCNPDQEDYPGLIRVGNEEGDDVEIYPFGITSLQDKREFLQKGDPVQFQIGVMKASGIDRAINVKALRKKLQATVDAIKGQFGFLSHEVDDGKKLFFHMSEVKEGVTLQQGDRVEFVIMHNQRNGRYSACNVIKINNSDPRPEHMVSRFRTMSIADDGGPRLIVIRQPRGPDSSNGFKQPRELRETIPITVA